jgi:hypothetical protein
MILYQFSLRGSSRTYMIESLQSPYMPFTLDTFPTHTHRYVTSILMLDFYMNPYATSSLVHHFMECTHIPYYVLARNIEMEDTASKH